MDRHVHWFQVNEKTGDIHSSVRLWQKIEAKVRDGKKLVSLFVCVHNFYEGLLLLLRVKNR